MRITPRQSRPVVSLNKEVEGRDGSEHLRLTQLDRRGELGGEFSSHGKTQAVRAMRKAALDVKSTPFPLKSIGGIHKSDASRFWSARSLRVQADQNLLAADLRIPPMHCYGNAADF